MAAESDPLAKCAAQVERGDPDRFLATMAAPPAARELLFPLYALNLEVARVPLLATEPGIARIRLGWWREALEAMSAGGVLPSHDVILSLAFALPKGRGLEAALDDMVAAREADITRELFPDGAALMEYLDRTAGTLLWVAAAGLGAGAGDESAVRAVGCAQGLANWLMARPALAGRGWGALPRTGSLPALAQSALAGAAAARRHLPRNPALLAAWRAEPILHQVLLEPGQVETCVPAQSEFARRFSLLWRAVVG